MLLHTVLTALLCLIGVASSEESLSILIVGSGPSGIAAGARLLEHGFDNLTILEAENRIGGRLYAKEFGGYPVDMGGQWVAGENNAIYELVWNMGLIEKSSENPDVEVYSSSGSEMPRDAAHNLMTFYVNLSLTELPEEYQNGSLGDWLKPKMEEYFEAHPDIPTDQRGPLLRMLCLAEMAEQAGDTWFNVSADDHYAEDQGHPYYNWKDKTYSTVIDVLLKKYPNPAEELPFRNKTILNAEVERIDYDNPDGPVRVTTDKGDEYTADHVIVTTSLGVLKANHETMFNPSLPKLKVNAIKGLEFGSVAKIYLFYPQPWWPRKADASQVFLFYWTEEDRKAFADDPEKSWLLGIYSMVSVEHKPNLLCCWLSGPHAREMESVSEEKISSGIKELISRFVGKSYNITDPAAVLRSQWYTNKHFRGTYSYRSPETDRSGALASHLAEPIAKQDKPRLLFAGEATSSHEYATVHGAIISGWREADRLIETYGRREMTTKAQP